MSLIIVGQNGVLYHYTIVKLLLATLLATGLAQCKSKPQEAALKTATAADDSTVVLTDAQYRNAKINTTQLSRQHIATVLRLNGKIDVPPQNLVSVSAPMGGYLQKTQLLPGMHIRKGELIAVMEDPQYIQLQQDYLDARSRLHFAQLDYTRQQELNQSRAASDKAMQMAEAEVNSQQIRMRSLAEKLQLININASRLSAARISRTIPIYSPIDGFVSTVNVNIGKYVNPADVLFELVNPADIHLNLHVYEKDVERLSVGQRVTAYTNTAPDQKFECGIILIGRDIHPDGTTEVHCHFENYHPKLLPGTYMNAEVQLSKVRSDVLPEGSIVNFEGKDYVFVQTAEKTYKMQPVSTGTAENGYVTVTDVKAFQGKSIVTNGAYTLLMKLKNTDQEED